MLAMACDVVSALLIMLLVPTATRAVCCVRSGRRPSPPSLTGMVRNMLFMPVCGRCRKRLTVCLMEASTSSSTLLPTPGKPSLYSIAGIKVPSSVSKLKDGLPSGVMETPKTLMSSPGPAIRI
ncbi:3-octaprenyl-4-hydroxybenzoate carboxy-lyase [Trichinella spiralis]|uniref:3-octaprenyl-4-hydroxybenzoate carboxy-lyase n=1 Tax=Trichinella spiralis TaxID=6334 RepID=A0ABR3KEJ4_TRISP